MHTSEPTFGPADRYALGAKLGDGGGGTVYRARDRALDIDVALKLMHPGSGIDLARLAGPYERLAKLDHPNVVRVLDVGRHGGSDYCAMELVEGTPLFSYARPLGRLDEMRLRESFSQLAEALDALHGEGLLHCDVKTSNVVVTPEGRAVLLDLDLLMDVHAEGSAHPATAGRPVGTPPYMSPEQASMGAVDAATDWYGLGVSLFECLTAQLPFSGSELDVLLRKQREPAPAVSSRVPNVPRDLDRLCAALLQLEPQARPDGLAVLHALGVRDEPAGGRLSLVSLLNSQADLVGRDRELEQLQAELLASRGGVRVVWLTGPLGVGKTSLCESFARKAAGREDRPLVLMSSCPTHLGAPHEPVAEIMTPLVEALAQGPAGPRVPVSATALRCLERAFPGVVASLMPRTQGTGIDVPDPLERRWRALDALRALLAELARQRPVLWCLDDYHRVDIDTRRLLRFLVERPDAPHMMLVLSGEMEPAGSDAADALRLRLPPLTATSAQHLSDVLCDRAALSRDTVPSAQWRDGALPLLVHERVRHATLFEQPPHGSLDAEALLSKRVRSLEPETHDVLRLLCCAVDPLPREALERASGLLSTELGRRIASLRMAGLARSTSRGGQDSFAPAHAAVADVVEAELTPEVRSRCHARLAAALGHAETSRGVGRLIRHQGEGGLHREAAGTAEAAAERAHERLAFQRAAELFALCASLDPPGSDERGHRRLKRMADALSHGGWSLQAASSYREAASAASPDEALLMRQRAAAHLIRAGAVQEGRQALRELLAGIGVELPEPGARAQLSHAFRRLWLSLRGLHFRAVEEGQVAARDLRRIDVMWATGLQLGLVDQLRGGDFMTRSLLLALSVGEPVRVARALCTEAWMTVGGAMGRLERPEAILSTARGLVESLDSPYLHGQLALAEGLVAFSESRIAAALDHCADAERVLRDHCADVTWETHAAKSYQLAALAFMARFDELRERLARHLDEAEERGDAWGCAELLSLRAYCSALTGDGEVLSAPTPVLAHDLFGVLAAASFELARGEDALPRLHEAWHGLEHHAVMRGRFVRSALLELRARAYVARARRTEDNHDLELALRDADSLERGRDAPSKGFACLVRANVAAVRGRLDAALDGLERGLVYLRPERLELWVPAAGHCLGSLTGGERGRTLQVQTRGRLQELGVQDAERLVRLLMPGF